MIAFAGDSITAYWSLLLWMAGAVNYGVPGETCQQVAARIPAIIAQKPVVLVILCGTNNDIATQPDGVAAIMAQANAARTAGIRVVLAKIPPRAWPELANNFNPLLAAAAAAGGFNEVIDYHAGMITPTGTQNSTLFTDGTHPNAAGYEVMAGALDAATGYTLPVLSRGAWGASHKAMVTGRSASGPQAFFDLLSVDLAPGEYDLDAAASWAAMGSEIPYAGMGISTAAGNDPTGLVAGENYTMLATIGATQVSLSLRYYITLPAPATVYLKAYLNYAGSTPAANARLSWTRRNPL